MRNPIHRIQKWMIRLASVSLKDTFLSNGSRLDLQTPRAHKYLSSICRHYSWYYLLLAQEKRESGDYLGAFKILMLGQRRVMSEFRIHLKLSELFRDDGNVYSAYTHLKIADKLSPGYCTIRRLTFETDHRMFAEGSVTMARVIKLSEPLIYRYMTMINRTSIFYPEYRDVLALYRNNYEQSLKLGNYKNETDFSTAISNAISNRWIETAIFMCKNSPWKLRGTTEILLNRLETDLGPFLKFLDLGWINENSTQVLGYKSGKLVSFIEEEDPQNKSIELFIPTSFFTRPDQEKPTYATVRRVFTQVIKFLSAQPNITLVPRLQLNWKECFPKTIGARIISYHTSAPSDKFWLHIQESSLAGRCSIDNSGFAGFSSIAFDYSAIEKFTKNTPDVQLIENQNLMVRRYVSKNVSKYTQVSVEEVIPDDYVFVVLQIPTDIVSKLAYISGIDLLQNAVNFFRGTATKVVVKRHPFCTSMRIQKVLEKLESDGDVVITKNSIHRVIANSRLVMTVNSGVGVEALIQGKVVIVSGACDYSYSAITVRNKVELDEVLSRNPVPDSGRIQRFLYFYVHQFTVSECEDIEIDKRLGEWLLN
jgi:Capsule polysaccharide biosynthesis protein